MLVLMFCRHSSRERRHIERAISHGLAMHSRVECILIETLPQKNVSHQNLLNAACTAKFDKFDQLAHNIRVIMNSVLPKVL